VTGQGAYTFFLSQVIRALYDYEARSEQELSFSRGDFFHVIGREDDTDWYEACNPALPDARGLVPVAFFQALGRTERDSGNSDSMRAPPSAPLKSPDHDSGYSDSQGPTSASAASAAGFWWLDESGRPDPAEPVHTWITARMTHVFALAHLRGDLPEAASLAEHGVRALNGALRDDELGGWYASVSGEGEPVGTLKEAYAHAFVVLAASSGVAAGVLAAISPVH
jgi:hypothetical protein